MKGRRDESGYAMVALLVGMSIMAVALSVALPAWSTAAKREREAELVFRGEQYARAVMLFQRKNGNAFPPSIDLLVEGRYLRKRYKDPMTEDGEFQPVFAGQARAGQPGPGQRQGGGGQTGRQPAAAVQGARGAQGAVVGAQAPGLAGVVSKSEESSLRVYNGRTKYSEWVFMATQLSTAAGGGPGAARPGARVNGPGGRGPAPGGRGGARETQPFPSPFPPSPGPRANQR